jgi:hypothetical protein
MIRRLFQYLRYRRAARILAHAKFYAWGGCSIETIRILTDLQIQVEKDWRNK